MTIVEGWRPSDATERRVTRSRLHSFVRATSHRYGASECMVTPVAGSVRIQVDGRTGRGHVSGVKRCRSPWACPVCAPTIRQRRAHELTELVERAQGVGHTCVLVTFTMPHKAGEALADTLGLIGDAWRRMWSGRWAQHFKADNQVVGSVRSLEVTWSEANGWHPHWHAVLFLEADERSVDECLVELWIALHRRWCDSVEAVGARRPSAKNGTDVELVRDAEQVGDYVADAGGWSIGAELACQPVKMGRGDSLTPFALLGAAAVWGDADARDLWLEYERATAGRHAIQCSPGLMAFYGVTEVTDEDAAAPEAEHVVASVEVDVMDWVALVELHAADRYVMAVEQAVADGYPPPEARAVVLEVLAERRRSTSCHMSMSMYIVHICRR